MKWGLSRITWFSFDAIFPGIMNPTRIRDNSINPNEYLFYLKTQRTRGSNKEVKSPIWVMIFFNVFLPTFSCKKFRSLDPVVLSVLIYYELKQMGIQTMNSHLSSSGQQSLVQHPLARQNSWFGLTLDEVENQLGDLGKPLGSMNLDELLKNVLTAEASHSSGMDPSSTSPAAALQCQASLSLARAFSGKTVNDVWRDIQQGYEMRNLEGMSSEERGQTLGETTLADFLVKAGQCVADASVGTAMSLDSALNSLNFSPQIRLSPSPSIDALSDTPMPGRKRDSADLQKTIERRLRRKIKNRESAARSRARKQAYHDELVSKVSRLEEENLKLKKENEFGKMTTCNFCEPRYQLRRTSSL